MSPEKRREFLEATTLGQAILRDEAKQVKLRQEVIADAEKAKKELDEFDAKENTPLQQKVNAIHATNRYGEEVLQGKKARRDALIARIEKGRAAAQGKAV